MYYYTAFGLGISSEIALRGLRPAPPAADLVLRLARSHESLYLEHEGGWHFDVKPQRATLSFADLGTLVVSEGREIVVTLRPGGDASLLPIYLTGTALAVLLSQRGYLVLHASAVSVAGEAIAFMAESGAGKSTLAAALHGRGHALISDDLTVIDWREGRPMVLPAFPQLKLARASAAALGYEPGLLAPIHPREPKSAHMVGSGFAERPAPLRAVYALTIGEELCIERLSPRRALLELIRHTYPTRMLQPGTPSHLAQCARLVGRDASYQLTRPDDLTAVNMLAQAIERHVLC